MNQEEMSKKEELPLFAERLSQITSLNCSINDCIIDIHSRLNQVDNFSINDGLKVSPANDKELLTGIECYNKQISFMSSNLEKLERIRNQVYKLF